ARHQPTERCCGVVEVPRSPETAEDYIERLTDQKFGVNAPGIALSAQRRARKDSAISMPIMTFQQELRKLSLEELKSRYEAGIQEQRLKWQKQAEREEAKRPFNQAYAAANFDYWSRAAYWTIDEGIALSLGKNPRVVNLRGVQSHGHVSHFARAFVE